MMVTKAQMMRNEATISRPGFCQHVEKCPGTRQHGEQRCAQRCQPARNSSAEFVCWDVHDRIEPENGMGQEEDQATME